VKEITFSTIPRSNKFLRNSRTAVDLQLLIEQCDLQWTVGRIVFGTLVLIGVGALLGNWWIAPGLLGWAVGLALGTIPTFSCLQKRNAAAAALLGIASRSDRSDVARLRAAKPCDHH